MNVAKVTSRLKRQMQEFSGKVSLGLPKVAKRFVMEGLYGIQARQSLRLSEWGRSLSEGIPLIKTINRLSRQLDRPGLWECLSRQICELGASRIGADSLLIVDPSDISKSYAQRMEYLGRVHDGSTGEIRNGYWTLEVVGCGADGSGIVPLYQRLYAIAAPDCQGENGEILNAVRQVSRHVGKQGTWVIDRGGDRRQLYDYFLQHGYRFLIRLTGDRHLLHQGQRWLASDLAKSCPVPYQEVLVKEEHQREKVYRLLLGSCAVRLPDFPHALQMVVVRGFGIEPLMLLTNVSFASTKTGLLRMLHCYHARWRVEETIRFVKQAYALEDVRVLSYRRLQNLMALVLAVSYFTMVYLGQRLKLKAMSQLVIKISQRIFGIPDFRFYAVADGIKTLLQRSDSGPGRYPPPKSPNLQFNLFSP